MNNNKEKDNIVKIIDKKIALFIFLLFVFGALILKKYLLASLILIIYLVFQEYIINVYKTENIKKEEYISTLIKNKSPYKKNIISLISLPIMFLSKSGDIIWVNKSLYNDLKTEDLTGKNIKELIKEINVNDIIQEKVQEYNNIWLNEKKYNLSIKVIHNDTMSSLNILIVITFKDITEEAKLLASIEEIRESVVLIEVDNLDDVIKATEEELRPQLIANIDKTINNYANSLDAMIRKYASNKYVLTTKDKNIEEEMSKKFSILDSIRELNSGSKLAVTLSMGVGRGGNTASQNHDFATTAKDLALGRGGDQCVVKSFEKVSFYGGKAKEVEKRTKVRARVIGHALLELINESNSIFIMGHHNPDMDCLGAAIGVYSVINSIGKEAYIVMDEPHEAVNYTLNMLDESNDYNGVFINSNKVRELKNDKSLLILVDVHNESYVLSMAVVKDFDRLVIIDHHRKTKDFIQGAILSYVETYASSTSELVTELIQYMVEKPKLKEIEAVALLSGICLDTKNFCFKTGVRTFEAAAFLRKQGADTVDVKRIFTEDLDIYITKADIIRAATVKDSIAIAKCPPDISNYVLTAQAADELLNIKGIQASFVIAKVNEDSYISARSLGDINVQVILEQLGGGGHYTMAAAQIKNSTQEEAEILLNEAIENYLRKGEE